MTEATQPLTEGTIRPVNLRAIEEAIAIKIDHVRTLVVLAEGIGPSAGDELDQLGKLRLVELQATQVRRAIVAAASAAGYTWSEIADTLALAVEETQHRYNATH